MRKISFAILYILLVYAVTCYGVVYYDDPLAIGMGARTLSMGKAFVAVADDSDAIYVNPAGLGEQKLWNFTTMSTDFMDEYRYFMISGVYPAAGGSFGARFVQSQIGGIIATEGGSINFYNQALVLSYGTYIGDDLSRYLGEEKNIYAGINVKYYAEGCTGIEEVAGSGFNLDLGIKYIPYNWLSFGMAIQNAIPGLKVAGNIEPEEMTSVTKLGMAFYWREHDVVFALDKDFFPERPRVACPMHFGVEWKMHKNLYLRGGVDQVLGSSGDGNLLTNTTFGVGFDYSGFKIDIARVQNFAELNMSSSFVSVSFYGGPLNMEERKENPLRPIAEKTHFAKQYTVAAGSYKTKKEAEKMSMTLTAKGYASHIKELFGNFLVQVGSFETEEKATALLDRLRNDGFSPSKTLEE